MRNNDASMIFHRTQNYLKRIKEIEELGPKV
jgi:hypothetical protein